MSAVLCPKCKKVMPVQASWREGEGTRRVRVCAPCDVRVGTIETAIPEGARMYRPRPSGSYPFTPEFRTKRRAVAEKYGMTPYRYNLIRAAARDEARRTGADVAELYRKYGVGP